MCAARAPTTRRPASRELRRAPRSRDQETRAVARCEALTRCPRARATRRICVSPPRSLCSEVSRSQSYCTLTLCVYTRRYKPCRMCARLASDPGAPYRVASVRSFASAGGGNYNRTSTRVVTRGSRDDLDSCVRAEFVVYQRHTPWPCMEVISLHATCGRLLESSRRTGQHVSPRVAVRGPVSRSRAASRGARHPRPRIPYVQTGRGDTPTSDDPDVPAEAGGTPEGHALG